MKLICCALLVMVTAIMYAQPANDDCNGAITLTSSASCNATTGTVNNATADNFPNQATCDNANPSLGAGVFYKFTAVSGTHTITVTPTGTLDAVVVLYSGGCFALTQVDCKDQAGGNGVVTSLTVNNLTIGQQYIIRVYDYGAANASSGGFTICVTHQCTTPAPPTSIDNGGTFCQSSTATYYIGANGSNSSQWHWYSGSCGGQPIATGPDINASLAQPGTTTYYVRTENACGNSPCLSATVNVTASVTPAVSITPTATVGICAGETVSFTAIPANGGNNPTYRWYLNGTQAGTGSTYVTPALNASAGVYCVITSNADCTQPDDQATSATTNITVTQPPVITINASANNITSGQSVTLTATGAGSYVWSNGLGSSSTVTVSPANTTTYTVSGTASGCSATASVTITVGSCAYNISPTSINFNSSAGSQQVNVNLGAGTGCNWSVIENCSWLTVQPATGSGLGSFNVIITANTDTTARTCVLDVTGTGQTVTVTQAGVTGTRCTLANPVIAYNGCDLAVPFVSNATYEWQWNGQVQQVGASRFFSINAITGTGYYTCIIHVDSCTYSSNDLYVAYGSPCTVGINEPQLDNLLIAPNPVTYLLTVAFNLQVDGNVQLQLFNSMGQKVYSNSGVTHTQKFSGSMDLANQPAGVYLLKIMVGGKSLTRLIQIQ